VDYVYSDAYCYLPAPRVPDLASRSEAPWVVGGPAQLECLVF